MVFTSKVDSWYYALIGAVVVVLLVALAGAAPTEVSALAVTAVIAIGLPVWLLRSTTYTVSNTELRIVSGPFRWSIAREDIVSVSPTNSMQSAPALSMDRLAIRYGNGQVVLVSPEDKEGFLSALNLPG